MASWLLTVGWRVLEKDASEDGFALADGGLGIGTSTSHG